MAERFGKTSLVAAPDKMVVLKHFPTTKSQPGAAPVEETKTLQGKWKKDGNDYELDLGGGTDKRMAKFEGNRLVLAGDDPTLVFVKED